MHGGTTRNSYIGYQRWYDAYGKDMYSHGGDAYGLGVDTPIAAAMHLTAADPEELSYGDRKGTEPLTDASSKRHANNINGPKRRTRKALGSTKVDGI